MNQSILVCGRIGSGKSTVASHLSKKFNIQIVSFGAMVKDKALGKDLSPTRSNLQNLGYEMFKSLGAKKLTEEAIRSSGLSNADKLIFDGVRHESVLSEIRKMSTSLFIVYLQVNEKTRFLRHKEAKVQNAELSFNDFRIIDGHQIELGTDNLEQYADVVIDASLPVNKVLSQVDENISAFLRKR